MLKGAICFVDVIIYLDYNAGMKKIVLLLTVVLLGANCVNAQSLYLNNAKKFFHIPQKVQKSVNKESSDDALTKSEQAVLLYNENNIKSSFEILLSIKEADRTAQDWVLLGNILQDQEKVSDAVFMYQRAIMVDISAYKAYYNLGNIYLEQEKPFLAIENYKKANRANSDFPYAYYNLGCAYLKAGDLKKAKIAFIKAIELKNTEPMFHYNLAYTYKMLNKPRYAKQYLDNYNKLMENNG